MPFGQSVTLVRRYAESSVRPAGFPPIGDDRRRWSAQDALTIGQCTIVNDLCFCILSPRIPRACLCHGQRFWPVRCPGNIRVDMRGGGNPRCLSRDRVRFAFLAPVAAGTIPVNFAAEHLTESDR